VRGQSERAEGEKVEQVRGEFFGVHRKKVPLPVPSHPPPWRRAIPRSPEVNPRGHSLFWPRSQAPAWERAPAKLPLRLRRSGVRFPRGTLSAQEDAESRRAGTAFPSGSLGMSGQPSSLKHSTALREYFATQSKPKKLCVATSPRVACCNKLKKFSIGIRAYLATLGLGRNFRDIW